MMMSAAYLSSRDRGAAARAGSPSRRRGEGDHHHHARESGQRDRPELKGQRLDGLWLERRDAGTGTIETGRADPHSVEGPVAAVTVREPPPAGPRDHRGVVGVERRLATHARTGASRVAASAASARLQATPSPSTATVRAGEVHGAARAWSRARRAPRPGIRARRSARSRATSLELRTAWSTDVLSPENENSNPSSRIGRGN